MSADNSRISRGPAGIEPPVWRKNNDDIAAILSTRSKEELIDLLVKIARENDEIHLRKQLQFAQGDEKEEQSKAIGLIRDFIRMHADRSGFVRYADAFRAVQGADHVLEQAALALKKGKYTHSVDLALCVIREMVNLLQNADDSSGVIGDAVESGFCLITDIAGMSELTLDEKNEVFKLLLAEAARKVYEGWPDWQLAFFEICAENANTRDLRHRLEKSIGVYGRRADGDAWSGAYILEKLNLIRYRMILQYDGEQKAKEFGEQHLQYPSFRKMSIERAMQNQDYDIVIRLAVAGEENDSGKRGLLNDWRNYRYTAYVLSEKLAEQRELAWTLILDGSFEYYLELKSTYAADQWGDIYPEVIKQLKAQKWFSEHLFTRILIEEGEMEKLGDYVRRNPATVEVYYEHLLPEYSEVVYASFLQHIEQTAKRASNRADYKKVCAIILKLKAAGGMEQAEGIRQNLFLRYRSKPAFKDELTRV